MALWEKSTRRVFEMIVYVGVLTRSTLWTVVTLLSLPLFALLLMVGMGTPPSLSWIVFGGIVWLTIALLRGKLVETLIRRRCFPVTDSSSRAAQLGDLSASPVEHVFCATDLVTLRPVYFSSRDQGIAFRRIADLPLGEAPRTLHFEKRAEDLKAIGVTFKAPDADLAGVVRASAGFPGIPPRRTVWRKMQNGGNPPPDADQATGFLSDGGIWNNLATQPFEDGFLWGGKGPWVVVVADASAPLLKLPSPWMLNIPGVAEGAALYRQMNIQNANTVGPRRGNSADGISRELLRAMRAFVQRGCTLLFPRKSGLQTC
jgi:hypothetical protein